MMQELMVKCFENEYDEEKIVGHLGGGRMNHQRVKREEKWSNIRTMYCLHLGSLNIGKNDLAC